MKRHGSHLFQDVFSNFINVYVTCAVCMNPNVQYLMYVFIYVCISPSLKIFKIQKKNNGSVRGYTLKYLAKREAKNKKPLQIKDSTDDLKKIQNGS